MKNFSAKDILFGPILRRSEPNLVVVQLASFRKLHGIQFRIRKKDEIGFLQKNNQRWIGIDDNPLEICVLGSLYFYYGLIKCVKGKFPDKKLLEYAIGHVQNREFKFNNFKNISAVSFSYFPSDSSPLPTFILPKKGKRLNALYGSCRKPHDAHGEDALGIAGQLISKHKKSIRKRPEILCLTGDQIYADDVSTTALSNIVELKRQKLNVKTDILTKAEIQNRFNKITGFTSGKSKNHLKDLLDYLLMYGLVWNPDLWIKKKLPVFCQSLRSIRKLLANIPTYMIFDDHDVTDDWNLDLRWKMRVRNKPSGRAIIGNALAAYWLCQGFGNDPLSFKSELQKIKSLFTNQSDSQKLYRYFSRNKGLSKWEFGTPTYPSIYFLDTRTQRGRKKGNRGSNKAPAYLKSPDSWNETYKILKGKQFKHKTVVLVAPAPVFGYSSIEKLSKFAKDFLGPFPYDYESWQANENHFKLFCQLFGSKNVVLLSGDVHYGFMSRVKYTVFDDITAKQELRSRGSLMPIYYYPPISPTGKNSNKALWETNFFQFTSSALNNYGSSVLKSISQSKGTSHFSGYDSNNIFHPNLLYENNKYWELWPKLPREPKPIMKQISLTRLIYQQFNSSYIEKHNIGSLQIGRSGINNTIYGVKGLFNHTAIAKKFFRF